MNMGDSDEAAKRHFIELTKILGTHTTFVKLTFPIPWNNRLAFALEALKDNRFIKHLSIESDGIDLDSARALTEMLTNNQVLLSLDLHFEVFNPGGDHGEGYLNRPVSDETFVELAHSLQASVLERLKIYDINTKGFEILVKSLPKTLIHLDLGENTLSEEIILILHSYLKSNGVTLKELILNDHLATEYLQQQEPSSLSTVKIMQNTSWEARLSRKAHSLNLEMNQLDDTVGPLLVTELTKNDTTFREIILTLNDELNQNHLNYLQTLFDQWKLKYFDC
ncbi:unnamed protein product [Rotaria sordida]|uniref:Ran GTPase-activating protein (RanGAP) involved in mRNA processing and transport n=1 Tax=Rotaria sordida TaxID=392033 RepID=A0A813SJK1_9BILA|nr:unnamed protein product [Rotaria sordida]